MFRFVICALALVGLSLFAAEAKAQCNVQSSNNASSAAAIQNAALANQLAQLQAQLSNQNRSSASATTSVRAPGVNVQVRAPAPLAAPQAANSATATATTAVPAPTDFSLNLQAAAPNACANGSCSKARVGLGARLRAAIPRRASSRSVSVSRSVSRG